MIRSLPSFLTLLVVGTVATASAQPMRPADNMALARKFWEGQGGIAGSMEKSFTVGLSIAGDPGADAHVVAFREALKKDQTSIQEADSKIIKLIADAYTNQELAAYVAFFDTPVGHSIMEKRQASTLSIFPGPYHPPDFTQEEKNALAEYNGSPEGKEIAAKTPSLIGPEIEIMVPIQTKVHDDYCQAIGDCPTRPATR